MNKRQNIVGATATDSKGKFCFEYLLSTSLGILVLLGMYSGYSIVTQGQNRSSPQVKKFRYFTYVYEFMILFQRLGLDFLS